MTTKTIIYENNRRLSYRLTFFVAIVLFLLLIIISDIEFDNNYGFWGNRIVFLFLALCCIPFIGAILNQLKKKKTYITIEQDSLNVALKWPNILQKFLRKDVQDITQNSKGDIQVIFKKERKNDFPAPNTTWKHGEVGIGKTGWKAINQHVDRELNYPSHGKSLLLRKKYMHNTSKNLQLFRLLQDKRKNSNH